MKIGIISDTHDHHRNVLRAVEIFNGAGVAYVLHGGDIVSPFTAKAFAEVENAKFIATYGNNDGEKLFLNSMIQSFGGEIHPYCFKGEVAGRKVFMTHTQHTIDEVARGGDYDLIIYGHTHKQDIRTVAKTLIINPGEGTDWLTGQGHAVILNPTDMGYEIVKL